MQHFSKTTEQIDFKLSIYLQYVYVKSIFAGNLKFNISDVKSFHSSVPEKRTFCFRYNFVNIQFFIKSEIHALDAYALKICAEF